MARFDVDFIFCCPCFVSEVHDSIFLNFNFNYECIAFCKRKNSRKRFEHEMFVGCKCFIVILARLSEEMYDDNLTCLYYNRGDFYQFIIENERFPRKKCYSCHRCSVRKLLKYYMRFVVSQ